jgi:hypothetical protein
VRIPRSSGVADYLELDQEPHAQPEVDLFLQPWLQPVQEGLRW